MRQPQCELPISYFLATPSLTKVTSRSPFLCETGAILVPIVNAQHMVVMNLVPKCLNKGMSFFALILVLESG